MEIPPGFWLKSLFALPGLAIIGISIWEIIEEHLFKKRGIKTVGKVVGHLSAKHQVENYYDTEEGFISMSYETIIRT